MPGFDGTGPRGAGPMTGRGEGYCAVVLPDSGQAPYGYAGLQGASYTRPAFGARFSRRLQPAGRRGRGQARGARRGRGRRFVR
ncbi:MAG: DUF5320 domain-containing protein [Anaerolineae bacterium]|nr:DUF5320 domain-containing protein [Anaerolineae bacterium]